MKITTRAAEVKADWRQVWDELGLQRPSTWLAENKQKIFAEYAEDVVTNVRQGDESGDLRRPNSPNIFGRQAYEDYMRKSRAEVVLDVAPKSRVKFDVRVHPPEISVQTRPLPGTER